MLIRLLFVSAAMLAFLSATPAVAMGIAAPRIGTESIDTLTVPARPFDEGADADRAVDAALVQARDEHRRILVDLGANWCADCRILIGIMELPDVRAFVDAHYVVVHVDVGRLDQNLQIPARFGVSDRLEALPVLLIVTPDGQLVNRGHLETLEDTRRMTPQAIADWLAEWAQ